ncbi:MAG: serine protease, partial [Solirubrobacteraceae bacterium]|nr:serine protease [Solirubrobacteraceae bacterium]
MGVRRLPALLAVLGALAPASAARAAGELAPPHRLPSAATAATSRNWLIGVRPGAAVPAGFRRVAGRTLLVPAARARAVAAQLRRRGALAYAEPDVPIERATVSDSALDDWARGAVVPGNLAWPAVAGPVAVIDDFVDKRPPDLHAQVGYLNAGPTAPINGAHGTEVASAIGAQYNGTGLTGVLPGVPIASWGIPTEATCSDVATAVDAVRRARIRTVNISLGSRGACFTEYIAVQRAFGVGLMVVAAAGNDYQEGNPVIYPAGFPHVMSVAAIDRSARSAPFSSANAAVDVSAPGVDVPLVTPVELDDDGVTDGYTIASGTSFAAPMVAGGAAWVRALRPDLSVGQLGDVLRNSAIDLARKGYDDDTGWGLMNIPSAIVEPTPANDPGEPNDGITMVNGTVFSGADPFVFKGRGSRSVFAYAD